MPMQLIVESGTDYRILLAEIEDKWHDCRGRAGHSEFEMADGTRSVYTIFVDTHLGDTQFIDFVQDVTDGKVEARKAPEPKI